MLLNRKTLLRETYVCSGDLGPLLVTWYVPNDVATADRCTKRYTFWRGKRSIAPCSRTRAFPPFVRGYSSVCVFPRVTVALQLGFSQRWGRLYGWARRATHGVCKGDLSRCCAAILSWVGRGRTLDVPPLYAPTSSQKRWGMARVVRDFTVLPAHPRVYPRTIWTMPLPFQPKLVLIVATQEG